MSWLGSPPKYSKIWVAERYGRVTTNNPPSETDMQPGAFGAKITNVTRE